MGKIVRKAEIGADKYVVAVPRVALVPKPEPFRDFDAGFNDAPDPFAAPFAFVAEPAEPPQPAIDWDALRADADGIVDRAASDARAILREAQVRAMELVESANDRAAAIADEARRNGHELGFAEGTAAAQMELGAHIDTMIELVDSARAERHEIIESADSQLVLLAVGIAERILHMQIAADSNVVLANVRHALTRLVSREVVTLRVNPADLEIIRSQRENITASTDVEHLRVVEDQRVDRGGVVIETEAGTIDAKIGTQLREARKAILTDDELALGPTLVDEFVEVPAQAS